MLPAFTRRKNSIFHPAVVLLMLVSTMLNIFLSMVVRATNLPFYIDTVGTITATALGGTVPGIITAFVTNAVNFFMDGESIFYALLNMIIAVLSAAYFGDYVAHKRKIKYPDNTNAAQKRRNKIVDMILFVFALAAVGGGMGGGITWYLYGASSDAPMSVAISGWFSKNMHLSEFGCHMASTYITDLMDKAISFAISMMIIVTVPAKLKSKIRLSSWRQKPLTFEEQAAAHRKLHNRMSIGTRINIVIIISTILMTIVAFVFSTIYYRDNTIEWLSTNAKQAAYLAAKEIDPSKVDEFIRRGYQATDYSKTRDSLNVIKNSSDDIAFLYVYKIEEDGCRVVFDLNTILNDGTLVEGDAPGGLVEFEDAIKPYKSNLLAGERIPTVQMEDEYGKFLAAYEPVYDSDGNCVCYAVSNIESVLISSMISRFLGRILLLFIGFLVLVIAISILTTRYHVVLPIMSMTAYANDVVDIRKGVGEESLEKIESLDIRTRDEVELLYKSFCKMTGDTVAQLGDIRSKSESIARMQNGLIITMADMVENRDSDTGAHVLKTAAYVRIILQGLKRNGYYSEKITDKYMRDVELSAPLHDVGKINISDTILNKPGKLSDEEYEIMKTHTIAGKAILEKAINSMEGDNYLKEARNMAAYHHERWDGKGYPEGLHGEVIPLSARIMAVADVFDALSSPRVYKPAFPFDEAMKIITDASGTQFDPKCVEVFAESAAEVKKVLKKYQEI